jgi:ATP-binding cassette subfamily C protein
MFIALLIISIAYFCRNEQNQAQMIGLLGGYLYVGFRLMPGLNRIVMQLNTFKSIIPCIDKVYEEYHCLDGKDNYVDCPAFSFNHQISLRDVEFQYESAEKVALTQVNLDIHKGECIGIIGETGSGKSTLSDLILGLLKPQKGTIRVDDQYPVNAYQWHAMIGYVPQAIYLTDDTIAANIAFGESPQAMDAQQLQQAIQGAQLAPFIQSLPQGLNTIVGERGVQLSGGERQRIAIARALYRQPQVIIFDEATSALDNDTENRLMQTIADLQHRQLTIIMIAHRLSTLKNCNRIIVMKKGHIDRVIRYDELELTQS